MAKETETRFDEQAFLLDFIEEFIGLNGSQYKNFTQLEGDPSYAINKIFAKNLQSKSGKTSKKIGLNPFFNLSTLQLSALVPKIRIYKISYKNKSVAAGGFVEYSGIKEQEFYFNDYTSPESVLKSNRVRGTDIGILSFGWEDTGTNEIETGIFFRANLSIYLQNIEAFNTPREGGLKVSDLLLPSGKTRAEKEANRQSVRTAKEVYDPRDYEIKVVVGWAVPDETNKLFSRAEREALKKMQVPFIMTSPTHEIEFNEDGTVTLNLDYTAAIDQRMRTPFYNLFKVEDGGRGDKLIKVGKGSVKIAKAAGDIKSIEEELKKDQARSQELTKIIQSIPLGMSGDAGASRAAAFQEQLAVREKIRLNHDRLPELRDTQKEVIADAERNLENMVFSQRNKAYARLIDQMQKNRTIYQFFLEQAEITLWEDSLQGFDDLTNAQEKEKKVFENRESKREQILKKLGSGREVSISTIWETGLDSFQKDLIEAGSSVKREAIVQKYLDATKPADGQTDIQFFFFGDLVEAAIEIILNPEASSPEKKPIGLGRPEQQFSQYQKDKKRALMRDQFQFILGPLELVKTDLILFPFQETRERHFSVAMADIPISAKQFDRWFVEYVIKPMKESYSLKGFLIDVLTALLNNALSPLGYGPIGQKNTTQMGVSIFTAPFDKEKDKELILSKGRMTIDNFVEALPTYDYSFRSIEKSMQFFFMYHRGIGNNELNGKIMEDIKKGIIHYNVGADRGIVKSVKFDVDKVPGRLEAQIEKAQKLEDRNFLYANLYNVVLETVGNPVFKPGMVFYLNPRSMGFGTLSEASAVGLGGYYVVTKVNSQIDDGQFTTTARGVFMSPPVSPFPVIETKIVQPSPGSPFRLTEKPGIITGGYESEGDTLPSEKIKARTEARRSVAGATFMEKFFNAISTDHGDPR
jgi:hypothetical protein